MSWRIGALRLLAALALLAVPPLPSKAQPRGTSLERLTEQAREKGSARVILEMRSPQGALLAAPRRSDLRASQERVLRAFGSRELKRARKYDHMPLLAAELTEEGLRAAATNPEVAAVHEDRLHAPGLADSAPLVGAPAAWDLGYGGAGQHIAILDTGVDRHHPFLAGRVVHEACFSSNYAPDGAITACPNGQESQTGTGAAAPCASAECRHGTHVAGIAAGNGTNANLAQPFWGVARDAGVIAVQVFSLFWDPWICSGSSMPCALAYTSDLLSALDHVYAVRASHSIAAVNMSLGGGRFAGPCDEDPLKPAIDQLRAAGIATVVASGNNAFVDALSSPACISSAVSVGASAQAPEGVAYFSNRAPMLNLLAPGVAVDSSVPGGSYSSFSGTSMAAPHVAGAFALLKQKKPAAGVDELLAVLASTGLTLADPVNGLQKPRIRLAQALDAVAPSGPVLAVSPAGGLASVGPPGGPFSPASNQYMLTNSGAGSLQYSASVSAAWATVSQASGTLAQGESVTITVAIDASAAGLAAGAYSGSVTFANDTNGVGTASRPLALAAVPAPANDKFHEALPLLQATGNATATNAGAGKDSGEPDHAGQAGGRSVWWRWTPASAGPVSFNTFGSGFDTVLAAYTGASVSELTLVAANDNAPSSLQSRIAFEALAGQTYYIVVDGVGAATGPITLNWAFGQDVVQPGDVTVTPETGFAASGPLGGPFTPASATYTLTNAGTGTRTFSVTGLPSWLSAAPTAGTLNAGSSAPVVLSLNASAAALGAGTHSGSVSFNGTARAVSLTVQGTSGSDAFAATPEVFGSSVTTTGSNAGASKEPGEPDHAGNPGGASVWWRWRAPASGQVVVDTFGSGFDTLLGVYTGASLDALAAVAANDDAGGILQSRVSFTATEGVEYRIAVDGYHGATGPITLRIVGTPPGGEPANNAFAAALELTGSSASVSAANVGATKEPAEPKHAGNAGGASVWWKWTAPATQPVSIDTSGSSFNTLLAVYTGSALSALTQIAANDDAAGAQSRVSFQAQQGATYFIAVDGHDSGLGAATGAIALNLSTTGPIPAGSSAFVYFSQPGDWIGLGQSRQLSVAQPGVTITTARNFQGGVNLSIRSGSESWSLDFGPPPAAPAALAPGAYENAVRYPFNSGLSPGVSLSGNGRGCNTIRGRFDVLDVAYAADGNVQRFAADFVQHCEGGAPALFGQIRFNSDVPLDTEPSLPAPFDFIDVQDAPPGTPVTSDAVAISGIAMAPIRVQGGEYSIDGGPFTSEPGTILDGQTVALRLVSSTMSGTAAFATVRIGAASATFQVTTALAQGTDMLYYHSQPGDYIGAGQQRALYAGTGYTLMPSRNYHNGVSFRISGAGQSWSLDFAGPGGAQLAAGSYERAVRFPFENGTSPGLSLSGDGRGCNTLGGRFDVLEVQYGGDGSVQRFAADFVQHCENGRAALFGQVRFNSDRPVYTDAVLPAPFAFSDNFDAPSNALVASDSVTISGIGVAPISVQGGEYSIDGGPFTGSPGTIANGQSVTLRLMTSPVGGTPRFATVRIGAASATFRAISGTGQQGVITGLNYTSQPGDFIGQGQQRSLHAGTGYTVTPSRNYHNGISFSIAGNGEWWNLDFGGPGRAPLAVGSYENAVRFPFENGMSPGLSFSGDGRGCNTLSGRFDVLEVAYGTDGTVHRFAADFVQHCEGGTPALFGQIRFNANTPGDADPVVPAPFDFADVADAPPGELVTSNAVAISGIGTASISVQNGEYSIDGGPFTSAPGTISGGQSVALRLRSSTQPATATFATVSIGAASATFQVTTRLGSGMNMLYFHSQPGDFIGQGQQRGLHAGTGFTITPRRNFDNGISFSINGNGQFWTLDFAAGDNQSSPPLAVGSYERAVRFPFQNGTSPGLSLSGDGRGCNTLRGRFDVLQVEYGADGSVQRFAADFAQHCEGGATALFGQIRFNSDVPAYTDAVLPAPFAFTDNLNAPSNSPVASNAVAISGFASAPIRVQGGQYSINGGPFTSEPGFISGGQTVALRVTTSGVMGMPSFATVRVGAAMATFQAVAGSGQQGAVTGLHYHSQPGDYIGQGRQRSLHLGAGYTVTPSRNYHDGVSFRVEGNGEWWYLDFGGPGRAPLAVGAYDNAVRFPFENGTSPGLSLTGNGAGCNVLRGRFDVLEIAYGADGAVQRFAADFVQHCEGEPPALFGQIRFNANTPMYTAPVLPAPFDFIDALDVPRGARVISNAVTISGIATAPISVQGGEYSLDGGPFTSAAGTIANGQTVALRLESSSQPGTAAFATVRIGAASATFQATTRLAQVGANVLYFKSQPGDWIGDGQTRYLHAGTGFTINASRNYHNGVTLNLNGSGTWWTLNLAAPGSSSAPALARGAYEGAMRFPFQAAGRPGLEFSGDGRGCNQLSGRFDVLEVGYGAGGAVSSFAANFEQRCENTMPPLLGRIRFNSSVPLFNRKRGDHDGDGRSDVLWRNAATGETYVYPMEGRTVLASEGYVRTVADPAWQVAGTGDFDGDGKADILWRNGITGQNYIYPMDGRTIKPTEGFIRTVADIEWRVAGIGDFDGDGKDDILWRHERTGQNYLYFMDGLSIKPGERYIRAVSDLEWSVAGVGDLDGDGKDDILWRNAATGQNYLYPMDGGAIKPSEGFLRSVADPDWRVAGVGDFDGDGKADIVWRHASSGQNYLYPMDGRTIRASEGYLRTVADPAWHIAAVGDYDGDGKSDLLWRNSSSGQNYLYPLDGTAIKPSEGYLRAVPAGSWAVVRN